MLASPSQTAEDDAAHAAPPATLRLLRRPSHNLPSHLSSFVGRERELSDIVHLLAPPPLPW